MRNRFSWKKDKKKYYLFFLFFFSFEFPFFFSSNWHWEQLKNKMWVTYPQIWRITWEMNLTWESVCELNLHISSLHLTTMYVNLIRCFTSHLRHFRTYMVLAYPGISNEQNFLCIFANILAIFSSKGRMYQFWRNI